MRPRHRRLAAVIVSLVAATALAAEAAVPDHPVVREIVAMAQAGVGAEVQLARLRQVKEIPPLNGEDLAALKQVGVSDEVLLYLVEHASEAPPVAPRAVAPPETAAPDAAPAVVTAVPPRVEAAPGAVEPQPVAAPSVVSPPAPPPAGAAVRAGDGSVRIAVAARFPISSLEVFLDGTRVVSRGLHYEGAGEPGDPLAPPELFRVDAPPFVQVIDAPPGEHTISVGYTVARVEPDPDDPLRQRYASGGVRPEPGSAPFGDDWGENPGFTCRVGPDQDCDVAVTLEKRPRGLFGGFPRWSIEYRPAAR